jgi:hypothetical protein
MTALYAEETIGAPLDISDFDTPMSTYIGASFADAWDDASSMSAVRIGELTSAKHGPQPTQLNEFGIEQPNPDYRGDNVRRIPLAEAQAKVKEAGLEKHVKLSDFEDIREPALDIMMKRGRENAERESTIQRGPSGVVAGVAGFAAGLAANIVDPLNLASAFIPVVGEANFARIAAVAGKVGARTVKGGIEGAVGTAALEPLTYFANTQEGQDYTMADSLRAVAFGTVLGGGLHVAGGAIGDRLTARRLSREAPQTVLDVVDSLSPETRELMTRGSIADLIEGRPVKAGEFAHVAAADDAHIDATLRQGPGKFIDQEGRAAFQREVQEQGGFGEPSKVANAIAEPVRHADIAAYVKTIDDYKAGSGVPDAASLMNFIKESGGIKISGTMVGDDVKAILDGKYPPGVINNKKGGISPDAMAQRAWEAGYIGRDERGLAPGEGYTLNDLLEALDTESRGTKIYRAEDQQRVDEHQSWARDFERTLAEAGVDTSKLRTAEEKATAARQLIAYEREVSTAHETSMAGARSAFERSADAGERTEIDEAAQAMATIKEPASMDVASKAVTKADEEFRLAQEEVLAYQEFGTLKDTELAALNERWAKIDEQAKDEQTVLTKGAQCLNVRAS